MYKENDLWVIEPRVGRMRHHGTPTIVKFEFKRQTPIGIYVDWINSFKDIKVTPKTKGGK